MKDLLSFLLGAGIIALIFVGWCIVLKWFNKQLPKLRLIIVIIVKYALLISLLGVIVHFDLANFYFLAGSVLGIAIAVVCVSLKFNKIVKNTEK
ncbi:MAG: hypothetical protein HY606_05210 [Planctomycetes bacterium]|nr:hypothetical protein [Planctomycetota bacterium]